MSELSGAITKLLFADAEDEAAVAARAVQALDELARHLAPLVGETGVRALLVRSVALSSATLPWLAGTIPIVQPSGSPWASFQAAMEGQDRHAITEGFGVLIATFIGLLERLIGEPLVAQLMHDVWPEAFSYGGKESR